MRRIGAVAVAALAGALALELLLRASGYLPPLTDRAMYVAGDDVLPHRLRPGYRDAYLGAPVTIDANGERALAPRIPSSGDAASVETILLTGDSIVFGHGLGDSDTLGSQLADEIRRRDLPYAVRNIGVPGYTSWNERAAVDEFFTRAFASFVIVVYVPNDVTLDDDHFHLREGRYDVLSDTFFHRATNWLYRHAYASYALADAVKQTRQRLAGRAARRVAESYVDAAAIDHSMEALSLLDADCSRRGSRLLVGIYRDLWHYDDPAASSRYEERIAAALDRRGLRRFALGSHVEHLPLARARLRWSDPHPSAEAVHWMALDVLSAVLAESTAER